MKLITNNELSNQSEYELSLLFWKMSRKLAQTGEGTPDRRNALANLDNISRARCLRRMGI